MSKPMTKEAREAMFRDWVPKDQAVSAIRINKARRNIIDLLAALDAKDEALEPFAEKGRNLDPRTPDNLEASIRVTAGDLRRAAEARGGDG